MFEFLIIPLSLALIWLWISFRNLLSLLARNTDYTQAQIKALHEELEINRGAIRGLLLREFGVPLKKGESVKVTKKEEDV